MRIGEVCLLTWDVPRLAEFYRKLLDAAPGEDKDNQVHQFVLAEETALTVMGDETPRTGQNAVLAFTVENMDAAFAKVRALGAEILEEPQKRPWGAVNMSFRDPDGNVVYFRCFMKEQQEL